MKNCIKTYNQLLIENKSLESTTEILREKVNELLKEVELLNKKIEVLGGIEEEEKEPTKESIYDAHKDFLRW